MCAHFVKYYFYHHKHKSIYLNLYLLSSCTHKSFTTKKNIKLTTLSVLFLIISYERFIDIFYLQLKSLLSTFGDFTHGFRVQRVSFCLTSNQCFLNIIKRKLF